MLLRAPSCSFVLLRAPSCSFVLYSGVNVDAIAVRIGSEPQEILPDDRAWGSRFPALDVGVDKRDFRFDQGVIVLVTAAQRSNRSAAGIGNPEHGFFWTANMVDVEPAA